MATTSSTDSATSTAPPALPDHVKALGVAAVAVTVVLWASAFVGIRADPPLRVRLTRTISIA